MREIKFRGRRVDNGEWVYIRNRKGREGKGWFWEVRKLGENRWKVRNHLTNEEFVVNHNGLTWEVES